MDIMLLLQLVETRLRFGTWESWRKSSRSSWERMIMLWMLWSKFTSLNLTQLNLRFDPSGQYLGAAGQDLRLYMAKTWAEITCYSSHEVKHGSITFVYFLISLGWDYWLELRRKLCYSCIVLSGLNCEVVWRRWSCPDGIVEQLYCPGKTEETYDPTRKIT